MKRAELTDNDPIAELCEGHKSGLGYVCRSGQRRMIRQGTASGLA